jgi:hypothetical protein
MEMQLTRTHQITYDAVFQHPVSRNLAWRDVRSMLGAIPGVVEEERDGTLKVSRNGRTLVLHRPVRKDMADVGELMDLRHFLEHSRDEVAPAPAEGAHVLVVIDHRLARVYRTEFGGAVPERIVPYDAAGAGGRHLHHVEEDATGQRKPEQKEFYASVARTIERAGQVLLFGSGTGASSAMDQLLAELDRNHKELRRRVIGSYVVDEHHLTEDQLLARAREIYAAMAVQRSAAVPAA